MSNIEKERQKIDKIDFQIIDLLAQRMNVVTSIATLKKENKSDIYQPERINFIRKNRLQYANNTTLDSSFLLKIVELLHEESMNIQCNIFEQQ